MTVLYVSRPTVSTPTVPAPSDSRSIWLESLDGSEVIRFDNNPITLLPDVSGLDDAPVDVVTSTSPGVDGVSIEEEQTLARPVLLPLEVAGPWPVRDAVLRRLRALMHGGDFRIVGSSASGVRQLQVRYLGGLEGSESVPGLTRVPLSLLAADPFARDREDRFVEFTVGNSTLKMVSANPATAGPRGLSSSVVLGEDMPVIVNSEVPVWVRADVFGPFDPLVVSASTGLSLSVPSGVAGGSQFTAVLDPRNRSFRLDGQLAAGLIARGSRIGAPFRPGLNNLSVAASGADVNSRITLSWRGGFRSLW